MKPKAQPKKSQKQVGKPEEKISKPAPPQKTKEEIEEEKRQEIENLNKNLMKKLYQDLFSQNVNLYQGKDLTFENFLFYFYKKIESSIDYTNPDYQNLLKKVDLMIKAKFAEEETINSSLNKNEIKAELNKRAQEDEWALISNYNKALYEDEKQKNKQIKEEKMKKYQEELRQQIQYKSNMNYSNLVEKSKDEIYLYDQVQKKELIEKQKVQNQIKLEKLKLKFCDNEKFKKEYIPDLENQNLDLNENNQNLLGFKINFLTQINYEEKNEEEKRLIEHIMKETKIDKINKMLSSLKYKQELDNQINTKLRTIQRPDKMSIEERKINRELLEASRNYFKYKK